MMSGADALGHSLLDESLRAGDFIGVRFTASLWELRDPRVRTARITREWSQAEFGPKTQRSLDAGSCKVYFIRTSRRLETAVQAPINRVRGRKWTGWAIAWVDNP